MKNWTMAWILGSTALLCATPGAMAQTVYRIVGPDGKVTFSDKPPASAEQGKVARTGVGANSTEAGSSLPFELKKIASKYPVTLYSADKCGPCDSGRNLLTSRGIPFTERTVNTPEDVEYFQRLTGSNSIPMVSIGGQRLKGFSASEWTQYLDAAGYPGSSALPSGYRNTPASPLVTVNKPSPAEAKTPEAPTAPATQPGAQPSGPTADNPTGLIF